MWKLLLQTRRVSPGPDPEKPREGRLSPARTSAAGEEPTPGGSAEAAPGGGSPARFCAAPVPVGDLSADGCEATRTAAGGEPRRGAAQHSRRPSSPLRRPRACRAPDRARRRTPTEASQRPPRGARGRAEPLREPPPVGAHGAASARSSQWGSSRRGGAGPRARRDLAAGEWSGAEGSVWGVVRPGAGRLPACLCSP